MMFKDIKQNYPVFIFNKQDLSVVQGKVIATTFPHVDMNSAQKVNPTALSPTSPLGTQMVVDVTIEAGGKTATYTIPESLSVTYAGNIVLSTDRECITREVEALKSSAEQVLSSVDRQKEIVEKTTSLLAELNPAYKEKKETEERFSAIEETVTGVKGSVDELKKMMSDFIKKMS